MVNSARRAKRRRLAQEAQRREGSRSAHQMDPADMSGSATDKEGDEDQGGWFRQSGRNFRTGRTLLLRSCLPNGLSGTPGMWWIWT